MLKNIQNASQESSLLNDVFNTFIKGVASDPPLIFEIYVQENE